MVSSPFKWLSSQSPYLCMTCIDRWCHFRDGLNEESFILDHSHKLIHELQVGCIVDKIVILIHMTRLIWNNTSTHLYCPKKHIAKNMLIGLFVLLIKPEIDTNIIALCKFQYQSYNDIDFVVWSIYCTHVDTKHNIIQLRMLLPFLIQESLDYSCSPPPPTY